MVMVMVMAMEMVIAMFKIMVNGYHAPQHNLRIWFEGPVSAVTMQAYFFDLLTHNAPLERVHFATKLLPMTAMMMINLSVKIKRMKV